MDGIVSVEVVFVSHMDACRRRNVGSRPCDQDSTILIDESKGSGSLSGVS